MKELLIDTMLSGTGVRDVLNGGYVDPATLGLSEALQGDLAAWHRRYEEAHFNGFPNEMVFILDREGVDLASRADRELANSKVGYYSDGLLKRLA